MARLNFIAVFMFGMYMNTSYQEQIRTFCNKVQCSVHPGGSPTSNCTVIQPELRGLVECAYACSQQPMCSGAGFDRNKTCHLHYDCLDGQTWHKAYGSGHVFLSNTPQTKHDDTSVYTHTPVYSQTPLYSNTTFYNHAPAYNQTPVYNHTLSHSQTPLYNQPYSEPVFTTCKDLLRANYSAGYHLVKIDLGQQGSDPFQVVCWITSNARTLILRNDGLQSKDKTWTEYLLGYGSANSTFWVGLERWHRLVQAGFRTIQLRANFYFPKFSSFRWLYYDFQMENQEHGFAISFGREERTAVGYKLDHIQLNPCLSSVQNRPFSTWDNDNDNDDDENCAASARSGWWYGPGCKMWCNVMGYWPDSVTVTSNRQTVKFGNVDLESIISYLGGVIIFIEE